MQIVGLMLARNEADILRVNLLHHLSSGIDRFLVVDNGSSDGTDRILHDLARGGRVRWTYDSGLYRQAEITTELAREASREGADWVIPIDADEFWLAREGDLRRVLERTPAGALRVQVINFVQRRDQIQATPGALIYMTRRAPLPIGPLKRVRELVESEQYAYVEVMYQPKWISRAGREIEIAMGDHAVEGIPGVQTDTEEILCLHAPLRARSALEAKAREGGRFLQVGLGPEQWWQARRWNRQATSGALEEEWRANSYEDDELDVFGKPHHLVFDPTLRDLVKPWLEKAAPRRRGIAGPSGESNAPPSRSKGSRSEVLHSEHAELQQTVQEQLLAHRSQLDDIVRSYDAQLQQRDQAVLDLQATLNERVVERDGTIRNLQSELHAKVGDRDRTILELQRELLEKVGERDETILSLQADRSSKVRERDEIIGELAQGIKSMSLGTPSLESVTHQLQTIVRALTRDEPEDRLREAWGEIEQVRERWRVRLERQSEREANLMGRLESAQRELQKQGGVQARLARTEQTLRERERSFTERERSLTERDRLLAQRDRALEQRDRALEHRDRAAASLRGALQEISERLWQLEAQAQRTAVELVRIHRSRLWRFGCAYWDTKARILKAFGVSPPAPPPFAEAAAAAPAKPVQTPVPVEEWTEPEVEIDPVPEPFSGTSEPAAGRPSDAPLAPDFLPAPELEPVPAAGWGLSPIAWFGHHYDVVCFPIIDWNFRFQRPQQLMSRFAAAGHRVFYVAPWFRTSGPPYEARQISEGIFEVSLRGPELDIYTQTIDEAALAQVFEGLDQLRRDWALGAAISFVQLPFWYPISAMARGRLSWPIVYDCMDYHAGFTTNLAAMLEEEEKLRSEADLIVASSAYLETEARTSNSNVLLLRNACDFAHFAGAAPERVGPPVVGYYGAIADWFDSDLVADLAQLRPDWRFVLVGSTFTANIERLSRLPNVELVGEVPYAEVPKRLSGFDVTILPFKRIPLTEATNPVKAYEILAAGKPLVSVPLPEMQSLAPLVRLASTPEEFEKEILEELRAGNWQTERDRRAFAAENTWAARFEVLDPVLRRNFPKVSIVVVTYNNLEMNRQCLRSIYSQTTWPNFEVTVVDNASTDGTREFLEVSERTYPRLSVILNDSNLGFAAANNQALKKTSGDYIVLLNNDTIVARGWLETLIRHLHANPEIGIIGPVTNAIGNEAMVPVEYSDVEQIPIWAQDYVRRHADEVFEIPMLAMFCVAMRREVFEKVGPLDERFGIGMFEDDDYAIRVRRAGYRIVCARDSFVHHWMKAAFGRIPTVEYQMLFDRNRRLFEEKWGCPWIPHSAVKVEEPVAVSAAGSNGLERDSI